MRRVFPLLVVVLLVGCGRLFEDNGTHLAYALEKAANELRASDASETVVHYVPLDGPDGSYYVEITPSLNDPGPASAVWSSYLVVTGKTAGGTSYHNRFVFVPKRLFLRKARGETEVVLRKTGDRVSVVELR